MKTLFRFLGLFAFMAFVAMAPPASAGMSFGIDNADMAYSVEYNDYIQLTDAAGIIKPYDGDIRRAEEEWIGGGGGIIAGSIFYPDGVEPTDFASTAFTNGGGGFGSRGIASL